MSSILCRLDEVLLGLTPCPTNFSILRNSLTHPSLSSFLFQSIFTLTKLIYMDTLFIPNETDFRKWIQEAVKVGMETAAENKATEKEEPLISRKQVAAFLGISLVTLTDWMKRGLPFHKLNGRVYFQRSEVLEYVKTNHGRRQSIYFKY